MRQKRHGTSSYESAAWMLLALILVRLYTLFYGAEWLSPDAQEEYRRTWIDGGNLFLALKHVPVAVIGLFAACLALCCYSGSTPAGVGMAITLGVLYLPGINVALMHVVGFAMWLPVILLIAGGAGPAVLLAWGVGKISS